MVKIAQCWDDGVATDIRLIELFRKYNAKATFNLNPGFMKEQTIKPFWHDTFYPRWSHKGFSGGMIGFADWKEVYGDFQVASHCWNHEPADSTPVKEFVKSALDTRKLLEDTFQRESLGFAWPGGFYTDEAAEAMLEAGFAYGRTVDNVEDVTKNSHLMKFASNCHFMDRIFWEQFELAKKRNGIFYFWGHSYEMFDCEGLWQQFEAKLEVLSRDSEVEWIDVIDIVKG